MATRHTATKQATNKDPRSAGTQAPKGAKGEPPAALNPMAPPGTSAEDQANMPLSTASGETAATPRMRHKMVEPMVSVTVPRGFRLTLDHGVAVQYEQGIQDMPKSHAEHFYAKANGVEINE